MRAILIINSGSSSLKWKVFDHGSMKTLSEGSIERIGLSKSFLLQKKKIISVKASDHTDAIGIALSSIRLDRKVFVAVGHRITHGGEQFIEPTLITPKVLKKLTALSPLAPIHQPSQLSGIRACQRHLPMIKQYGVFDTAFFHTMPDHVYLYALPLHFYKKYHIRRYGFHGISHEYVAKEASKKIGKPLSRLNMITCHLGSGSSIAAIRNGKAFDTTMGMTPCEGLTMSTRAGDLDPMVPLFLLKHAHLTVEQIEKILFRESGILGISGISSDFRDILHALSFRVPSFRPTRRTYSRQEKKRCQLALSMFLYDIARYLASYFGLIAHVHALVFTGGIGERSALIRRLILSNIRLPRDTKIFVIPANEELAIAEKMKALL